MNPFLTCARLLRTVLPWWTAAFLSGTLMVGGAESAERAGRDIIQRIRSMTPEVALTNRGRLVVRPARPQPAFEVPLQLAVFPLETGWCTLYEAGPDAEGVRVRLWIRHQPDGPPNVSRAACGRDEVLPKEGAPLPSSEWMQPVAGSDFTPADLAMAFLWWPRHRLIRSEMRRGQFCDVVESETDEAPLEGYVRVRAWWDRDTGGLVYAEAFDAEGRLMKEFLPRRFQKVQGRWEVTELEMIHRQRGSRTRLVFELP